MKRNAPLSGVIVILSLLWCVLLGLTVWVWSVVSRGGAPPAAGAAPGAGGAPVALVWSPDSVSRFLERLEWAGLALIGVLVAAVVVGVAVQEKTRRRDE